MTVGGGAKRRAHHLSAISLRDGGHATLCPPYALPTPQSTALQWLVVIAVAITLRRGDVAVLVVVILDRNTLRLLRFVVRRFRRLVLPAGSAHVMPFLPDQSAFALHADSEYRHDLTLIALGWHVSADRKNF